MKNNNGKGLYNIGESTQLPCGCSTIAEEIGYTHYIHPECHFDNRIHPKIKGYRYEYMPVDSVDKAI